MVRLSSVSVNGLKVVDKKDRSCQESHQRHWIVQVLSTERGERGVGNPTSRQCVVRSSPFYNTSSHQVLTNPTSRQWVVPSRPFYRLPVRPFRQQVRIKKELVLWDGLRQRHHC